MNDRPSVETIGDTIDEAVAKGLAQLGANPSEVIVEVLEEPSRGIFGIGARPAKVRVQMLRRPTPPPPPPAAPPIIIDTPPVNSGAGGSTADGKTSSKTGGAAGRDARKDSRPERQDDSSNGGGGSRGQNDRRDYRPNSGITKDDGKGERRRGADRADSAGSTNTSNSGNRDSNRSTRQESGGRRDSDYGQSQPRSGASSSSPKPKANRSPSGSGGGEDYDYHEEYDAYAFGDIAGDASGEEGEISRRVLTELLEHLEIQAEVMVSRAAPSQEGENPPYLLNVQGRDVTSLIGRRGETLSSLQYITRLIASRRIGHRANIVLDVDSYKARRSQKLRELAVRMADQAVKEVRTVVLEPMPPHERRMIHMALRSREDVFTRSTGEGDARKVTIVPK